MEHVLNEPQIYLWEGFNVNAKQVTFHKWDIEGCLQGCWGSSAYETGICGLVSESSQCVVRSARKIFWEWVLVYRDRHLTHGSVAFPNVCRTGFGQRNPNLCYFRVNIKNPLSSASRGKKKKGCKVIFRQYIVIQNKLLKSGREEFWS